MRQITNYITEKFKINKDNVTKRIVVKSRKELLEIIGKRIENRKSSDEVIDFNDLDVSGIEDMRNLFSNLDGVSNIDISEWDVSNVKNMRAMFNGCRYLKSTGDLGNWDISKVEDFSFMFSGCRILKNIGDLSKWKIDGQPMEAMFNDCNKLKTIGDIYNWKPKNANWAIFQNCPVEPQPRKRI